MGNRITVILASPPEDIGEASKTGLAIAVMAYRIGRGFHLYRTDLPLKPGGDYMVIDDMGFSDNGQVRALATEIVRECILRAYRGVVLNVRESLSKVMLPLAGALADMAEANSLTLWLPPHLASKNNARILIGTALSGGTLVRHFADAGDTFGTHRLALDIECIRADFTLPSPTGAGINLSEDELSSIIEKYRPTTFFSKDLCTSYFNYRSGEKTHFVLYDSALSIRNKLEIAAKAGIKGAFLYYPEVREILSDIIE